MLNVHPINSIHLLELTDLFENKSDSLLQFIDAYSAQRGTTPVLPIYVTLTSEQLKEYQPSTFYFTKEEIESLTGYKEIKTMLERASHSLIQELKTYPDDWFSLLKYFYQANSETIRNRNDAVLELVMAHSVDTFHFVPSFDNLRFLTYTNSKGRLIPHFLYGLIDKGYEYDGNHHQIQLFSNGLMDGGYLKSITFDNIDIIQAEFSPRDTSLIVSKEDNKHKHAWMTDLDMTWRELETMFSKEGTFEFSDEIMTELSEAKSQQENQSYVLLPLKQTAMQKAPISSLYK